MNEPRSIIMNCLYRENMLYVGNVASNMLHLPVFHYAQYIAFKRFDCSMYRSKARNRCHISGNARAVLSLYKMSRFASKTLAKNGNLNGITKSSLVVGRIFSACVAGINRNSEGQQSGTTMPYSIINSDICRFLSRNG